MRTAARGKDSISRKAPPGANTTSSVNGQEHEAGPGVQGISAEAPNSLRRATFGALAAGRPLLDRFSTAYLCEIGIYVYENLSGESCVAISTPMQLSVVETIEWTL